ncbi:DNA (Cytosine-5-)-methyltransferase [Candidatus Desulfosporosinus infrequens]|uniref:DNA (cytosine-5-)-methyltransferase n=1 Tax=Candidatus Desulfosporosinus infrequens TaxID=2043169 RepID=A0A2U3LHA8_9FIRM|nr:DNA (Cytosine-5-)-methyltransferase [Candidatus Desulfosporosinus infrequens]
MNLTFIDLFCGIGTIRMGMEQAGHKCVYSVEWDKHKRQIYKIIFGKEPEGADIRATNATDIPRADMWCFGAPCQDFSIAGKRAGLEGDRSSLVSEVFRLVRETPEEYRPKYILYENVKGMLSSNKGFDYLEILYQMDALGYDVEWELLNSKNFGVPQNRERVFTVGHLRGRGTGKVFPLEYEVNEYSTIGKSTKTTVARTLTAGGHSGGNHSGMTMINVIGMLDIHGQDNIRRVYGIDGLSPCITPCEGGNRQPKILIEGRLRRLTPREFWRLQSISDLIIDKVMLAGISDTQMYRGAGDACTTKVILEIGKKLT